MARPQKKEKEVRKLFKIGGGYSYGMTLPVEVVRKWGWQERQKVTLEIDHEKKVITIKDWKK